MRHVTRWRIVAGAAATALLAGGASAVASSLTVPMDTPTPIELQTSGTEPPELVSEAGDVPADDVWPSIVERSPVSPESVSSSDEGHAAIVTPSTPVTDDAGGSTRSTTAGTDAPSTATPVDSPASVESVASFDSPSSVDSVSSLDS